ncbi:PREDICTED: uncharacterized protein LOC106814645, partial [Priapulus caudatus]|uniref:Uncharacterized protein LOC106814645 n=1 Tax=Priapulus caudatus TaxID=37621 RepID=A0ABM1EQJ8_PRICU
MPQVISAVKNVLESASGCDKWYRYVAKVLRDDHGLRVRRDDIRLLLGIMDPEGVAYRKKNCFRRRQYVNKGPNYMWHVDGNGKLKPYGFAIHGAIDGFSRRILWLEVAATNKKPELVAKFFLKPVKELK